jgi:hypothetical protein
VVSFQENAAGFSLALIHAAQNKSHINPASGMAMPGTAPPYPNKESPPGRGFFIGKNSLFQ